MPQSDRLFQDIERLASAAWPKLAQNLEIKFDHKHHNRCAREASVEVYWALSSPSLSVSLCWL